MLGAIAALAAAAMTPLLRLAGRNARVLFFLTASVVLVTMTIVVVLTLCLLRLMEKVSRD